MHVKKALILNILSNCSSIKVNNILGGAVSALLQILRSRSYLQWVFHRMGSRTSGHSPASPWPDTWRLHTIYTPSCTLAPCTLAGGSRVTHKHQNRANISFSTLNKSDFLTSAGFCCARGVTRTPRGSRLSRATWPSQGTQYVVERMASGVAFPSF